MKGVMNILVYKWDIFPYDDIIETFQKQGHWVNVPAFSEINHLKDEAFEQALTEHLTSHTYDFVFSVNYFAVIARVCHRQQIRYVSWNVDTPLISMQTDTVFFPENRIFTFDQTEYRQQKARGVESIFYLPLAGNPMHFHPELTDSPTQFPVSFVGTLYDKNRYDEMCCLLPDYLCGYLDSAIEAQLHVSRGNILTSMITEEIFQELKPFLQLEPGYEDCFSYPDAETNLLKLQFNTCVLSHKIASISRIQLLNLLAADHVSVHLFTTSDTSPLRQVQVHPPVDYHTEMFEIFQSSQINFHLTAPNIESGIPLRVWDVLSAGGFLLTDCRPAYDGLLQDKKELVLFDGPEDCIRKVKYYLAHPEERCQIAHNGHQRILQEHNYQNRIQKMLCTI